MITNQNEIVSSSANDQTDTPMCIICYMEGIPEDLSSLEYNYENPFDEGPNRLFRVQPHYHLEYRQTGSICGPHLICRDCLQQHDQICPMQCHQPILQFDQRVAEILDNELNQVDDIYPDLTKQRVYAQFDIFDTFPISYLHKIVFQIKPSKILKAEDTYESMIERIVILFKELHTNKEENSKKRFKFLEMFYLMTKTHRGRLGLRNMITMKENGKRSSKLKNFVSYDYYIKFEHPLLKAD